MLKKILFLLLIFFIYNLNANYIDGKKIFDKQCSSCHKPFIKISLLKENFFEKNNKLLNLTIPTVNMLAYAITRSSKHIGDENDPEMQQIEIEEYLKNYLENPDLNNSVCDEHILKYYEKKKAMKISDDEAENLATFFMEYKKNRLQSDLVKTIILTKNYDEKDLLEKARELDKYFIVYATSKTCYFCKRMKKEVLDLAEVQNKINKNYIFLKVDIDYINLPFGLQKYFKGMTPTFFVLDKEAKLLNTYPGAWVKKDFLEILKENLE